MLAFSDVVFVRLINNSASRFHKSMLFSVLRCTMGFFESTPVGRIINRFSKDIQAVEEVIPNNYKQFGRMLFTLLISLVTISIASPYFIIVVVLISIIYILIQVCYINFGDFCNHQ